MYGIRKPQIYLALTIASAALVLSGCSPNKTDDDILADSIPTTSNAVLSATQFIPNNFVLSPQPEAAKLPSKYYNYLNQRDYTKAIRLWTSGPREVYGSPGAVKYLKNIEHSEILKLEDITKNRGFIPLSFAKYYAVKVYVGVVKIKTKDPSLVPGLDGINVRRYFIVKASKNSPWEMFMEQGIPKESAFRQWGIKI